MIIKIMKIVIMTVGTEGDVRPHIALGEGLLARGHAVRLAADPCFETAITRAGLKFSPLTADFSGMMRHNPQALDGSNGMAAARVVVAETRRMAQDWPAQGLKAAEGATLLIGSGNVSLLAASLAERLQVPFVQTQLQPLEASHALPPVWFRPRPLPASVNFALHRTLRQTAWLLMRDTANRMRRALDLPLYPLKGPWHNPKATGGHILFGFSQHVVPRQPEWPARIAMPGYFVSAKNAAYTPDADLAHFLQAGDKPAYIGFGSMVSGEAAALAATVQAAVQHAGLRAVVGSGWSKLGQFLPTSARIHVVDHVPHEWLFSKMRLAVHHCGAGTAAAAVRAGIPTVPVPFVGDQYFWGWQLHRIGVATPTQSLRTLTAQTLADAMLQATSPHMVANADRLGSLVRAEDGTANAITQLERWGLLHRQA
ncbi:glycosyl hydrolase [Acetobacter cibinongensis]|uniref:Glycosyl hydrolase n=3 Tax=Acetobacter cibinongensis TaxID=146475 RepID=A0A0D6N5X3_9PROT|nr:glycosyltransferase [Acetobacter cibinongensis]GAN61422.1 glycosyl transferase [Acetobacter cibinongensis]GEL60116.1 glycosyl hydrolase [Acetobacter cibinongensis]